jgi:hypothetical protein
MMNDELKSSRKARPRRSGPFIIHNSSFSIFSWPVRVYYEDTDLGGVVSRELPEVHAEAKDSPWGRGARGGERTDRQGAYNTVKRAMRCHDFGSGREARPAA